MPTKLFAFNQFNRSVSLVTGVSVLGALTCPLMSDAAEAADIDKVPVPAMVAAVASGVSQTTIAYVFPLSNHDGVVVGHSFEYRSPAYIVQPPQGSAR